MTPIIRSRHTQTRVLGLLSRIFKVTHTEAVVHEIWMRMSHFPKKVVSKNCAQNKNRRVPKQAPYIILGRQHQLKTSVDSVLTSSSISISYHEQLQPTITFATSVFPFVMQALLQSQLLTTMFGHQSGTSIMEPFYGLPPHVLPTMAQQQQNQHRASSSSPSHNRHGGRRRKAVAQKPYHLHHLERSLTIIPPASFQALLGWMLATTQELAGFAVPRQGTRPWSTATQADRNRKNLTTGTVPADVPASATVPLTSSTVSDPISLHDFNSYYHSFLVPFSEILFLDRSSYDRERYYRWTESTGRISP